MYHLKKILSISIIVFLVSCKTKTPSLPYIGEKSGNESGDTIYHTLPDFELVNQENQKISLQTVTGKIHVANFFFTSCPSICPVMMNNMKLVDEKYASKGEINILSFTVDPKTDTIAKLKKYADKLEVSPNWQLITGEKQEIYSLAEKGYFSSASEDEFAPGGFLHSELFFLVDEQNHVRGIYDGTKEEEVKQLLSDIKLLKDANTN